MHARAFATRKERSVGRMLTSSLGGQPMGPGWWFCKAMSWAAWSAALCEGQRGSGWWWCAGSHYLRPHDARHGQWQCREATTAPGGGCRRPRCHWLAEGGRGWWIRLECYVDKGSAQSWRGRRPCCAEAQTRRRGPRPWKGPTATREPGRSVGGSGWDSNRIEKHQAPRAVAHGGLPRVAVRKQAQKRQAAGRAWDGWLARVPHRRGRGGRPGVCGYEARDEEGRPRGGAGGGIFSRGSWGAARVVVPLTLLAAGPKVSTVPFHGLQHSGDREAAPPGCLGAEASLPRYLHSHPTSQLGALPESENKHGRMTRRWDSPTRAYAFRDWPAAATPGKAAEAFLFPAGRRALLKPSAWEKEKTGGCCWPLCLPASAGTRQGAASGSSPWLSFPHL